MGLSLQYTKDSGETFEPQVGLDVADYTLSNGRICSKFYACKDSKDNVYIVCIATDDNNKFIVLKIDKNGVVTKRQAGYNSFTLSNNMAIQLSRDEQYFYTLCYYGVPYAFVLGKFKTDLSDIETLSPSSVFLSDRAKTDKFALYQDRYIWVGSGSTVKIYDYMSKAELASSSGATIMIICSDVSNKLYVLGGSDIEVKTFNGVNSISSSSVYHALGAFDYAKQMLIDKYGDLIILTNSGTASTLLKYTTAGVQVGTTLDLGGAFYNLNTDKDGNYYYSNALGTYKITANTAQGQAFTGVGVKIRGNGLTTYGNNISGYAPAVFGTQE